jgi:hypothetical protein
VDVSWKYVIEGLDFVDAFWKGTNELPIFIDDEWRMNG